jgi:pyridoxine 5-phosphate synthase
VRRWSEQILDFGAHGLTVHPRPDGRHIQSADVTALRELTRGRPGVEFNVEGYPAPEFLEFMLKVRPEQCTLVPDPPEALTSSAGWDLVGEESFLQTVLKPLQSAGIRVSLFVDPNGFSVAQEQALRRLKPERIELYTESYADHFGTAATAEVSNKYRRVAEAARLTGAGVNAGHDLNQRNLGHLLRSIPWMDEVSIGHALICEALEQGMESTIRSYLRILAAP